LIEKVGDKFKLFSEGRRHRRQSATWIAKQLHVLPSFAKARFAVLAQQVDQRRELRGSLRLPQLRAHRSRHSGL
jgi:hypothetical protein